MSGSKVIVALDFASANEARQLVARLQPDMCRLKVGKELFVTAGPGLVAGLVEKQFDVFLDLKFHDIPNTVAAACKAAANLGVWMVNVHALGGRKMMLAARDAVEGFARRPQLIAVTVLTSMGRDDLRDIGLDVEPQEMVMRLASLAKDAGLDGVVCSAQEAISLKQKLGEQFKLVTPGIRPTQAELGDQKRVMTPVEAIKAGADYLVIGRPITQAKDPLQVLNQINQEIEILGVSK